MGRIQLKKFVFQWTKSWMMCSFALQPLFTGYLFYKFADAPFFPFFDASQRSKYLLTLQIYQFLFFFWFNYYLLYIYRYPWTGFTGDFDFEMVVAHGCTNAHDWTWEQSDECARLPRMWPGFDSGPMPYMIWEYCWFSPCSKGFSPGSPVFNPHKSQLSKFQFDPDMGPTWKAV